MSSYVYMKVLESTPQRYDRGIRMLSGGRIDSVYRHLADLVAAPGRRVLDIGCGTGNVSLACAARGARVLGIDINNGMLEVARAKSEASGHDIEFLELGALEIEDRFGEASFDSAVSCLTFSELTTSEQVYVLKTLQSIVQAGGTIAIADEVAPKGRIARWRWQLRRSLLVAVTWLLTQTTTHPVSGLERMLKDAGLQNVRGQRLAGSFLVVHGTVPKGRAG